MKIDLRRFSHML